METYFWGATLRFVQAFSQAAPTILVGALIAAVLQRLIGQTGTRRLFGAGTWKSLFQAWFIGMLLPVCSLGVIPIVRELRRAGISGGTILAFALAAPLFNPLSLLYGLTLSEPLTILVFAAGSLVVVTLVGLIWDRLFPNTMAHESERPAVAPGPRRLTAILVSMIRELVGPSAPFILAGLLGVAGLSVFLPPGSLQSSMNADNRWAPLLMSVVALPAYATPMLAMSQLGSMFQHGNSVGAAFALLAMGAGMNLGLLWWMWRTYGTKRSAIWLLLLELVVVGLSYGVDRPFAPAEIESADHTHAFDVYCRPFHDVNGNGLELVRVKLSQDTQVFERWSLAALGVLALLGIGFKLLDQRGGRIESWLEEVAAPTCGQQPWHRRPVPAPVLGGAALIGLIAFSLVGCFAFYPPPQDVFEEMRIAKAEALTAAMTGHQQHAAHWIDVWDDWTRKLQVGVYLRHGRLSDYHRTKARLLRDRLELLEHEVEEGDRAAVAQLITATNRAYERLQSAFLTEQNF